MIGSLPDWTIWSLTAVALLHHRHPAPSQSCNHAQSQSCTIAVIDHVASCCLIGTEKGYQPCPTTLMAREKSLAVYKQTLYHQPPRKYSKPSKPSLTLPSNPSCTVTAAALSDGGGSTESCSRVLAVWIYLLILSALQVLGFCLRASDWSIQGVHFGGECLLHVGHHLCDL